MKITWMKNMLRDLLSGGYLYPGNTHVITASQSSSLRCMMSLMDLDEEFTSAMRHACAQGGLGFGVGSTVLGNGTPVMMFSPMPEIKAV